MWTLGAEQRVYRLAVSGACKAVLSASAGMLVVEFTVCGTGTVGTAQKTFQLQPQTAHL